MQNWDDLRFFLAIAHTGTVSAAADKLRVNQSTVSRRINAFEEMLKVRLFERLSIGYKLTPEGEKLLSFAERIEQETQAIERQLAGVNDLLSGPIRVSVPQTLATHVFMPIFTEFYNDYPDIELQIVASNTLQNISQREVDVALRVSQQKPPENLVGRKLGEISFGVYGLKRYLSSYQCSTNTKPLLWIGEDINDSRPDWLSPDIAEIALSVRVNEALLTIDAINKGLGVGRLPKIIGDNQLSMAPFTETSFLPSRPLWLLTHPDLRRSRRISVFLDYLAERIRPLLGNTHNH